MQPRKPRQPYQYHGPKKLKWSDTDTGEKRSTCQAQDRTRQERKVQGKHSWATNSQEHCGPGLKNFRQRDILSRSGFQRSLKPEGSDVSVFGNTRRFLSGPRLGVRFQYQKEKRIARNWNIAVQRAKTDVETCGGQHRAYVAEKLSSSLSLLSRVWLGGWSFCGL